MKIYKSRLCTKDKADEGISCNLLTTQAPTYHITNTILNYPNPRSVTPALPTIKYIMLHKIQSHHHPFLPIAFVPLELQCSSIPKYSYTTRSQFSTRSSRAIQIKSLSRESTSVGRKSRIISTGVISESNKKFLSRLRMKNLVRFRAERTLKESNSTDNKYILQKSSNILRFLSKYGIP